MAKYNKGYSIPSDIYYHGYDLRKTVSSFTDDTAKWLSEHIDVLLPNYDNISLLSIGCGDGQLDLNVLRSIDEQLSRNISYIGIELNENVLDQFQTKIDKHPFKHINIDLKLGCFGQISLPEKSFDLILMAHIMPYFSSPFEPVDIAMRLLKAGGKLVIINQCLEGIPKLQKRFCTILDNWDTNIVTSEDIQLALSTHHIQYTSIKIDTWLDTREIQHETKNGNLLMSFCLGYDFSLLTEHNIAEIREEFIANSKQTTEFGYQLYEPMDILIVEAN